jgi:hypothetical protein
LGTKFLRNLTTNSYLEVIVGDHGPGILGTLRPTFERDHGRPEHHETRELNVLEYAFGKYVSCKANPDAYLEDAINRASGSDQRTITGLFFAKTVAAEHGALLAVRSGATWLAWDFSKGAEPRPVTHKDDRRLGSLHPLAVVSTKFSSLWEHQRAVHDLCILQSLSQRRGEFKAEPSR